MYYDDINKVTVFDPYIFNVMDGTVNWMWKTEWGKRSLVSPENDNISQRPDAD